MKKLLALIAIIAMVAVSSPALANGETYCYDDRQFQAQVGINTLLTGIDIEVLNEENWDYGNDYYYSYSDTGSSLFQLGIEVDMIAIQAIGQIQMNRGCCPQNQSFHNYMELESNGMSLTMTQSGYQSQGYGIYFVRDSVEF